MKTKFNLLHPLLVTILATCCLWVVTDVAYNVRVWELNSEGQIDRIKAFIIILVTILVDYLFFHYLANISIEKNKNNKPQPVILEYLLVTSFAVISFNISLHIIISYINHTNYRWGEGLMINATGIPILLFFYTTVRNNILARHYSEKILQLEKLKVDQLETELKLLRSQYHPHFLFNALNTVYFQIDEENEAAIEAVELLSNLLRYQLYDINTQVTIRQEIDYLQTYIQFQRLRMTEQLRFDSYFDPGLTEQKIHPLLFQPLLENAFKYVGGDYHIEVEIRKEDPKVHFRVKNTVHTGSSEKKERSGIGIDNLCKRLDLLYPGKHSLRITNDNTYFTVDLWIELSE